MMATIVYWIVHYGYWALFGLLMLGIVGLPVPDETLLTFAGYLVFRQQFALLPTLAAAFCGSICGMSLSYGLGRTLGRAAVERLGTWLHLNPTRLDTMQAWYHRHGKYTLLVGYFLPGIRHLTAYVAGWSQLPLLTFALFASAGGCAGRAPLSSWAMGLGMSGSARQHRCTGWGRLRRCWYWSAPPWSSGSSDNEPGRRAGVHPSVTRERPTLGSQTQ
jgi:membrane protein DedA with SNARE-associated domain